MKTNRWNEPILSETQAKRQHFVSRFYLEPFTGRDGKLRVVDLQLEREYTTSTANVAVQSRFYDISQDGHDFSAEDWLSDLEGKADGILQILLNDPSAIATLTDEQENDLSRFIAALVFRTPSKREEMDGLLSTAYSQIESKLQAQFVHQFGENQGDSMYGEWQSKPIHERYGGREPVQPASTTISLLAEVQGYANLLRAAPWRIGNVTGRFRLYTSDNPVARHLRPVRKWWDVGAFASYDYFLPLSPDTLLKVERRIDKADTNQECSCKGDRRKKNFSEWEVSMARHIMSRSASRYLYGEGIVIPKQDAEIHLARIEEEARELAIRYLGVDPSPPQSVGFPSP